MTLHDTTVLIKKAGIGSAIGITTIILIVILVRVGISIKNSLYPPKKNPPTQAFGVLAPLQFPKNVVNNNFTYTLQTLSGELPTGLPDRLSVFPIVENQPNFLNLDNVKNKVRSLGFVPQGEALMPEITLNNPYYEWDEPKDFNRKIIFDINSFDFKMTSDYLSSASALSNKFISDEASAMGVAQNFLNTIELMPSDFDLVKTGTRLFSIESGQQNNILVATTSLSKTQVIRVDFYQKDVEYNMNTGITEVIGRKLHLKLPILYPQPPYSIMNFWIASGLNGAIVTQAFFTHKNLDLASADATYKIKTPEEAFIELKNEKAYIAAYNGIDNNIFITDVYLAYYLTEDSHGYMMPIYVFEGKNGFFAYVSAIL